MPKKDSGKRKKEEKEDLYQFQTGSNEAENAENFPADFNKSESEDVSPAEIHENSAYIDSEDQYKEYIANKGTANDLSREEQGELWERVRNGDSEAKEKIFELNTRLVVKAAKKFMYSGAELMDLVEEGNLGLLHAISKYDASLGYRFSTYASYWIEQHIRRYVEENSRAIRIPPHAWTAMRKWQREYMSLKEKLGRNPDISEMAKILGWTEAQVRSAMNTADIAFGMSSIDSPRSTAGDDSTTLEDTLHSGFEDTPEHLVTEINKVEKLKDALGDLDPREREILEARYGLLGEDPKTLNEIGQALNLSRERVRQLEARALQALRRKAISLGLADENKSKKTQGNVATIKVVPMSINGKTKDINLRIFEISKKKKGDKK